MDEQPRTTDESLDDVLQLLAGDGHVSQTDIRRAESWARDKSEEAETPWYLQPLIFFGALLAAGMLTVGIASMVFDSRPKMAECMTMGAVYMVVALVLHFSRFNDFTGYLGLSFSIGAHVFLLVGVTDMNLSQHPEMAVFFTAAGLCAALYGLYRDFLHRFLSCALVIVVANFAFPEAGLGDASHGLVAAMAATCAVLLTRDRQNPTWRPLAYACGYGLPILLVTLPVRELWFEDPGIPHHWISAVILGLGTLWALDLAAKRLGVSASMTARAFAVLVVAGLCSLAAPGILAAFFLIVLGYASHHWQLVVVGLVALPVFVFEYYYNLEIDFMTKSGVLAGSGALLLLARWAMVHSRWFENEEEGA